MFVTKTKKHSSPSGEVTTRHLEGSIVETTYSGYCTIDLIESVRDLTPEVVAEIPRACWLVDLTAVTGSDRNARVPGAEIFRIFREGGGERLAVVLASGPLRMVMTAVAFAAGLPLKLFEKRADALAHLRTASRPKP